uniref:Uncharacterized protein n=1 Tax=Tanacetum cinerariifolium TaxID=118510 RepID=A0A6L2L3F3_TANCI|nr:hypothetical protein [Tanacetum cinerariifolium]
MEQWLDLKYDNHETMDENTKTGVIATWLIRRWKIKEEALKQKAIYERSWEDATRGVRNHIHGAYANTNINDNYNPYMDVSRAFNNHEERDYEETINEERESNDANAIDNLDFDLVMDNISYHDNEEKEHINEDRCELLRNPRQDPPVCKIRRFTMIKYSFGPNENYVAIKECEYRDWTRTEDDACHGYQDIFHIID